MMPRSSASFRRSCLTCLAALVIGCGSTSDYLGYNRSGLRPLTCPVPYQSGYRVVLGQSQAKIDDRLELAYNQLFHGNPDNEAIYFETVGTNQASIRDILHNNDVRTEGMSLGMLVSVLMNRRNEFDRLWRYASKNLVYTSGPLRGYFRSRCDSIQVFPPAVAPSHECADPYGLQQFVMALLIARQRWAKSELSPDYEADALSLFQLIRGSSTTNGGAAGTLGLGGASAASGGASASANGGAASTAGGATGSATAGASTAAVGTNAAGSSGNGGAVTGAGGVGAPAAAAALATFDETTKLVFDEPGPAPARLTGTSLEMPGYYSVWAQVTGDAFYAMAATEARAFLRGAADPNTGLLPVRAWFDATPVDGWRDFSPEAYRALLNLVIDRLWATDEPWQNGQIQSILQFFYRQDINNYGAAFTMDGRTTLDPSHVPELVLVNGVIAALAGIPEQHEFVDAAWNVPVPTGQPRYFRGILYLLSNLILGGRFQVCP